jgi:hypothetical protein
MGLAEYVERTTKAPLWTVKATFCRHRHDLSRWQRSEFWLVAGQQDSLTLLVAESEGDVAAPALLRGERYAQQTNDFMDSCPGCHRGLEDLQGLATICFCG